MKMKTRAIVVTTDLRGITYDHGAVELTVRITGPQAKRLRVLARAALRPPRVMLRVWPRVGAVNGDGK
jgi:hypothetical protein